MQTPNKEGRKLPMLTPKNPDGSQRVIKQIMVIDPNKLRVAGLDLKMAEALKKAKGKITNISSSKDTKLAIAKSIVSKKIRQAQLAKESNNQTKHVASPQLSDSISIQDAIRNLSFTNPTTPKPQIKVANLKTLMPPPSAPVSTHPQTVLLSFLNSNKSDVVNTSPDSNKRNAEPIPKASTKKLTAEQKLIPPPKTIESKVISSEVKFEMKKPKEVEAVAPKIIEIKVISPTKEAYSPSPPHKHRPRVLESKVLSPEEKIDLRTLNVTAPPMLHPLEPPSSSPAVEKGIVKEIPAEEVVPPSREVESAVDFINNLSFMFEGTSDSDSVLKNACGEDATSFLMSVFEQMPTKVAKNSTVSSKLPCSPEKSPPSVLIDSIPSKMPEVLTSNDAVPQQAARKKQSSLKKTNQQTVASKVSETPPKIVKNVKQSLKGTSASPKADSPAQIDKSPVKCNKTVDKVVESSPLKKSPAKDNHAMPPLEDSSPSLPCETELISSEDKPRTEETPSPASSAASARRKARKSVPVLIAKLNKNRKTPVSQEKQPEPVEAVSKTEDKPPEKLEEPTKVPEQDETTLENVTASTSKPSIRRRSTKSLPIVIAKLNVTRKPSEVQKKPSKTVSQSKSIDEESNKVEPDNQSVAKVTEINSHESQKEFTVATPDGETVDLLPKSAEEVLIPRTNDSSEPSPELEKLAEDVVMKSRKISERSQTSAPENKSTDASAPRQKEREPAKEEAETAGRSRKTSERSKSVDVSPTTQKEHAIVQPAEVAASVEREEVANTSSEPSQVSEETGESKSDSTDLQIEEPSQTEDRKEEDAAYVESTTDTSHDGCSESQGLKAEFPAQQALDKYTEDATLEKSDATPSHTSGSTENPPPNVDQEEPLPVIEITETATESSNIPEPPKAANTAPSVENTSNSTDTSHPAVESASTEGEQTRQSSKKEEELITPPPTAKTRRSTAPKILEKPDKAPDLDKEQPPRETASSPRITKVEDQRPATKRDAPKEEVSDGGNEVPYTPAPASTKKSRSKSKAGLFSEKTTKELPKESASTSESNEKSVQEQPPVWPRSQRSTRANSIKADSVKDKADPVAKASKTRRRAKAEPIEELSTTSVTEAVAKSNEPPKGKTSRRRTTIEVPQTVIDNSKGKKAAPESTNSGKRSRSKSKVPTEAPPPPTDDSSRTSVNSLDRDDCDPDVEALLDIVTAADEASKQQKKTKNNPSDSQQTEKKEDTSFFGFNEQEIEEGQQSTSLRLSQSEDVVPVRSPPKSGGKKKQSPPAKGKKQKAETDWKKNSSASLKNWLTTPSKTAKQSDAKLQQEINSSIPLKKRRARDQSLDIVEDIVQGDASANEAPKEVESNQASTSEAPAKPRQGKRKSDQTDEFKSPAKTDRRTKRKRSSVDEDTEPAAKKAHLLPKAGQLVFARGKLGRPAKQESPRLSIVSPRERKYKNDTEFNPRLLLITQKEEIKHNEPLVDPEKQTAPTSSDDLQCALCMGFAPKKKWFLHISNHYGIGWVVGDPPPLNIKSRPSVLNYMVEFFKNSRVKGLNCRICKRQRRSALGLLTHLEQCSLTEDELRESRVLCEHCHHEYSKFSLPVHLRTCQEYLKKIKAQKRAEPVSAPQVAGKDEMLSNTGRLKRKSVIKAESKLKSLDDSEFIPDEVIKRISAPRLDLCTSTWRLEIESYGKAFCVEKKCPFTAATVDELVQHSHVGVCPFMEKVGFKCMKCKFHSVDIEPCRLHVVEKHSPQPERDFECSDDDADFGSESSSDSISSGVDGNDEDGEHRRKPKKKTKKRKVRIKTHQSQKDFKKLLPDRTFDIAYRVRKWYEKFVTENFSTEALFDFATPSIDCRTENEGYESYFPKSPISMKFVLRGFKGFVKEYGKTQITPEKWQTLERLTGTGLANEHAAYLGGPVKSIAWAPLEPHPASNAQYLAVATRKEIDKFTKFKQPRQSRVLISIVKYSLDEANVISGDVHFAFPIDEGPVHCVEFLPSGGYAPNLNRLGLLAVATVVSEIKIYSLPLEVEKKECDIFPIVRLEPSIELCLEIADRPSKYAEQYQSQCMSIAWSQTAGHNYVIGGYLNGFVAIWDIAEEDDNLNRFLVNGLRKFVPVTYFWTMDNRINHVVPHYDMDGLRWLGVCNQNRKIFLYDLREMTNPVLFYAETTKNICNSFDWPVLWENPSCGHGDAMPSHGKCINTISPMSLVFVNRRFDKFCCGVNDISHNPWRNLYAGAGDNGDIHVTPLREAVLDVGLRMKIDEKAMCSLDIVSLDGGVVSKTLSDGVGLLEPDYKQKYGLVFGVPQRIVGSKRREMYADIRIPPLNMARLMRVNRLRFNPNRSADCLLAVGYENGFVRVIQSDWHKTP